MNQESYERFVKEHEDLADRAREILKCILKDSRFGYCVDNINFDKDVVGIDYTETVMGNSCSDFTSFPAYLLYTNNWKELYNHWSQEKKKESEALILLRNKEQAKKEKQERLKQYHRLKEEFEPKR